MIFANLAESRATLAGTSSLSNPDAWLYEWLGSGMQSLAGVRVTAERVAQLSSFFRGVDLMSDLIGYLPMAVIQREGNRRIPVPEHPVHQRLTIEPNEEQSDFAYRKYGQKSIMLGGAHPAEIVSAPDGSVQALKPIHPDRAKLKRRERDGLLYFEITQRNGATTKAFRDEIFYVYKWSDDGLRGKSVIEHATEQWGISIAVENFAAQTFGRGIFPGLLIQTTKKWKDKAQRERARATLETQLAGQHHRVGFIEDGMAPISDPIYMRPEEAQLLLSRNHTVEEVARYLGMPVYLLALDRPYQQAIDSLGVEFIRFTFLPWVRAWETEANRRLLTPRERFSGLSVHFNLRGLLRGDLEAQGKWYQLMRQLGVFSADDILALEDLDPLPDGQGGGDRWRPVNMVVVGDPLTDPSAGGRFDPAPVPPDSGGQTRSLTRPERRGLQARWRIRASFRPLLEEQAGRLVTREVNAIRKAAATVLERDGVEAFLQWLSSFYEEHGAYAVKIMRPVLASLQDAIAGEAVDEIAGELGDYQDIIAARVATYADAFGSRHSLKGQTQLEALLEDDPEDPVAAVETRLDEWKDRRPGKVGLAESTRAAEFIAREIWIVAGVSRLVWRWNGGDCTICPKFDGRTVEITKAFAKPGDVIQGADGAADMEVKYVIHHPPAHGGCECGTEPA